MKVAPSQMEAAPFQMEVAQFLSIFTIFVDFHHFLSIFTIYALLLRFTFCRDLRTFSANSFWPIFSTILDGSSTIFVDFHHFLSIFKIYALLLRFIFCRDLLTFSAIFFLAKIALSATSHVFCMYVGEISIGWVGWLVFK